jgi:GTP cyclohydrolase II
MDENISDWLKTELDSYMCAGFSRPAVTLSYAQTLDGSISAGKDRQTKLSCDESMILTHTLRSIHDAILAGIGTITTDDPRLTARLVNGNNPIPVVLDSYLNFPENARLLSELPYPIIFHSPDAPVEKQKILAEKGSLLLECEMNKPGFLYLDSVLFSLWEQEIYSLMVEGGAVVLTEFLTGKLWDFAVITLSPRWLGGYRCISSFFDEEIEMIIDIFEKVGNDLVIAGKRKTR